ncbi:MAG: stage II sporulation protein R [Ruminococcus sp.]|nr:stage II sporulation protein R [Ruminococcus sp.]
MKRMERILLIGLIGAICWNQLDKLSDTTQSLREEVLRLHILANSDSKEDQQLKLEVRDALLASSETLFGDADSLEEMIQCAEDSLDEIEQIAADVIAQAGETYSVHAEVVKTAFEEKTYDTLTMPAGVYDALRVTIGEAEGQNWWCVMYPPLCIPAAETVTADTDTAQDYFSEDELDVMQHPRRYRIRFKCLELFDRFRSIFW